MTIKNYDEVFEAVKDMLLEWDIADGAGDSMHKDMYLYVDENGKGRIYEFESVDGNSWLNDDHITLESHQSCEDMWEVLHVSYDSTAEIADVCGISEDELIKRICEAFCCDESEAKGRTMEFLQSAYAEDLAQNAINWYSEWLRDSGDYETVAREILDENKIVPAD